jgi:hypothetical protein
MTPLATELLNRHKRNPTFYFFGDKRRPSEALKQYGLSALDQAYKELTEIGFVEQNPAPILIPDRRPFQLTLKGRDAVPSAEKS